jgi:hypothetical protein
VNWRDHAIAVRGLPPRTDFRHFVSGDLVNKTHARQLISAHKSRKDLSAWLYSASWHVDGLTPLCLELAKHVKFYASVSSFTEYKHARDLGFKLIAWAHPLVDRAFMASFQDGRRVLRCPHEVNRVKDCQTCRWCISGQGDVVFKLRCTGAVK